MTLVKEDKLKLFLCRVFVGRGGDGGGGGWGAVGGENKIWQSSEVLPQKMIF